MNQNAQTNGDHEVHTDQCSHLPNFLNRRNLGFFRDCHDAVKKAKEYDKDADGCYYCCNECHAS